MPRSRSSARGSRESPGNPTWVADQLARTIATGVTTIDGVEWTVYDNRESNADVGNARYGLVTEAGTSTFVLIGTATTEEFETLADGARTRHRRPALRGAP